MIENAEARQGDYHRVGARLRWASRWLRGLRHVQGCRSSHDAPAGHRVGQVPHQRQLHSALHLLDAAHQAGLARTRSSSRSSWPASLGGAPPYPTTSSAPPSTLPRRPLTMSPAPSCSWMAGRSAVDQSCRHQEDGRHRVGHDGHRLRHGLRARRLPSHSV